MASFIDALHGFPPAGGLDLHRDPWLGARQRRLCEGTGEAWTWHRMRRLETYEGWSVSCLDMPGGHSQGESRDQALDNIREAVQLWLEVKAEEAGVKTVETLQLAV